MLLKCWFSHTFFSLSLVLSRLNNPAASDIPYYLIWSLQQALSGIVLSTSLADRYGNWGPRREILVPQWVLEAGFEWHSVCLLAFFSNGTLTHTIHNSLCVAVWPQASYYISMSLIFFSCPMGIITPTPRPWPWWQPRVVGYIRLSPPPPDSLWVTDRWHAVHHHPPQTFLSRHLEIQPLHSLSRKHIWMQVSERDIIRGITLGQL